jgi:hypothetical protein
MGAMNEIRLPEASAVEAGRFDHHALSAKLERLARLPGENVSIGEISRAFGDSAFGALMLVLGLIGILPSLPGTSTVVGVAVMVVAVQLVMGASTLWLPRRLSEKTFPRSALTALLERTERPLRWVEAWSSPRLPAWFTPLGRRLIGLLCLVMAVALALPLPLLNFVPGLSIVFFALGLLQRDGVAVLLGVLTVIATLVGVFFLGWLTVWVASLWS